MILGDDAAGGPGGPTILVIEPGQHVLVLRLLHAGADQVHEFWRKVRRGQAGADVHMEAAEAHGLQLFNLPEQLLPVQVAVPRPERRPAVFAFGMLKQFIGQFRIACVRIEHCILTMPSR